MDSQNQFRNLKQIKRSKMFKSIAFQNPIELKQRLKNVLISLKSSGFKSDEEELRTVNLCETTWFILFLIGIQKVPFNENEKKRFGPLIESVLNKLEFSLSQYIDGYEPGTSDVSLVVRSAVEFLMNDYRNFPNKNGQLLFLNLDDFKTSESVDELTDAINRWKNSGLFFCILFDLNFLVLIFF